MAPLVALVTGANVGLGYHTALHLARLTSPATYTTLVGARSLEKATSAIAELLKEDPSLSPDKFHPLLIDLDSDDSITAAAKQVEEEFGHLDLLINNAAISGSSIPSQRQLFQDVFNTNVIGTWLVTQAFLPLLKKSNAPPTPGTRIVNVSSRIGSMAFTVQATMINQVYAPYAISKAALNMANLYNVDQVKKEGLKIGVVAVCPGYTKTKLNNFSGTRAPDVSALNIVGAATKGSWEDVNGKFLEDDGAISPW